MKREVYSPELDIEHLLARPTVRSSEEVERVVAEIFDAVRNSGDAALYRYSEQLDGARLHSLRVSPERMEQASRALPKALRRAVEAAGENIRCFHVAQRREPLVVETTPGIVCERRSVPIERVGLYIPGGSAPLFSTLLMLAIPAELAGCRERVLVSPPDLHPIILAVAHLLEITEVYEVGGAQAIA
ncbi:histidinol dehydrogenase, partial [bacterium]|nr:histidinol dehydrogenase [bacterium]